MQLSGRRDRGKWGEGREEAVSPGGKVRLPQAQNCTLPALWRLRKGETLKGELLHGAPGKAGLSTKGLVRPHPSLAQMQLSWCCPSARSTEALSISAVASVA